VFSTAGTTGVRGLFLYDADEFAVWIVTCLRGLACWGLGPGTRLAHGRHQLGGADGRHAPAHGRGPGVAPLDFYGTTEALVPAAGRQGQTGMDILEDLVVLEVVDERNRPVPPGVPGHKVLLTNLVNRVQLLLRHELTDSVTLAGGPNRLGLPYARLAGVDGRSDDAVRLPAAGGGEVAVHPFRLRAHVLGAAGGPPVPGRPRPRRPARRRGAA
jgi:phenylacetate-coenzyme A ligase PaaK-like adenylate-forming protein